MVLTETVKRVKEMKVPTQEFLVERVLGGERWYHECNLNAKNDSEAFHEFVRYHNKHFVHCRLVRIYRGVRKIIIEFKPVKAIENHC